jgi:hypothetical protein
MQLDKNSLEHCYNILSRFGNMSSPTIFYCLNEYLRSKKGNVFNKIKNIYMIAFGPGMTIEIVLFQQNKKSDINILKNVEINENNHYMNDDEIEANKNQKFNRSNWFIILVFIIILYFQSK